MLINFFNNKYFINFLKYSKNHNILIKKISFLFIAFSMLFHKAYCDASVAWQIDFQGIAISSMLSVVGLKILLFKYEIFHSFKFHI